MGAPDGVVEFVPPFHWYFEESKSLLPYTIRSESSMQFAMTVI